MNWTFLCGTNRGSLVHARVIWATSFVRPS